MTAIASIYGAAACVAIALSALGCFVVVRVMGGRNE